MTGVLAAIDQRTKLVGQNRLELLLFRLDGPQVYGINVFKVREVLQCPKLTEIPQRDPIVRGIAHIRGSTVPVMDINLAIGRGPIDLEKSFVIISEYNSRVQGFLVRQVERIANLNWEDIHPPPKGSGSDNYLTAVTELEGNIIEVLDVEKILAKVSPVNEEISEGVLCDDAKNSAINGNLRIMIADDSSVARNQLKRCINKIGIEVETFKDGKKALDHLKKLAADNIKVSEHYLMLISDIEMPEMDGYTLTSSIRHDADLKDIHIVLHTSLSGVFNEAMVQKVGADKFLAKFMPDRVAEVVQERVKEKSRD